MIQPFVMKKDMIFQGALDFSFLLDAPAGKHGFIAAREGHFYAGDGRIRFYGFNIPFMGLYMPHGDAETVAERLACAGMNFVRIHAEDAKGFDGSSLLVDYSKGDSKHFDAERWDRLDYLMHCLKRRGIYMQLDTFCYRRFLPGDGLDYPDDLDKYIKQANVFNRRLIALQKEFAEAYLTHLNPYTGLRYMDDPAVAVVQVMNEDGIFWYEGRDETGLPSYRAELDRRFNWWLLARYGSREALDEAWTNECGARALGDGEDPVRGTVKRLPHLEGTQMYMDWKADYRGMGSPARYADYTEFLTGLQLDFSREMKEFLLHLGVKCPINISNHAQGAADIMSLDRYADVNQDNAYWNHPDTVRRDAPRYHSLNMVENDPRRTVVDSPFELNLVTRLNHDRVAGKPFMAAEWNNLCGTDFRSDALPMVAAYASLQDWDGMVLYAYHHAETLGGLDDGGIGGPFDLYNDPATWGQAGLCSYLFQRGLMRPGRNRLEVCYSERDLYAVPRNWIAPYGYASFVSQVAARFIGLKYEGTADAALASGNTPAGDYTAARHGFVFSRSPYADGAQKTRALSRFLEKHRNAGENFAVAEDGNALDGDYRNYSLALDAALKEWGLLEEGQGLTGDGKLVSDTGELEFDFKKGVFRVNAPQLKAASGNIKGKVSLGRFGFDVVNGRMTLSLLSLDGKDTDASKHLLLVALGWCGNPDMLFVPQPDGSRILADGGHGPVSIDALEGGMKGLEGLAVYPLRPDGSRGAALPGGDACIFSGEPTMYYEICPSSASSSSSLARS
jgi:hypothetical protein